MASESEVNVERLRSLLAEEAESSALDYKETCDLNDRRDLVSLAKHVGALLARGGHIVIGADNNGKPSSRFTHELARLFDEATLRPKLARFLPQSIDVRTAMHVIDGAPFAIVHVARHANGLVAFLADGDYDVNGKTKYAFHRGQIYTRHGTSSEPCTQADIRLALQHQLEVAREALRAERAEELAELLRTLQGQTTFAKAPADALTWDLDEATFIATIIEQLRAADDIPVRLLLHRLQEDASQLIAESQEQDLGVLLDRLACLGITLTILRKDSLCRETIDALEGMYGLAFQQRVPATGTQPLPPSRVWLLIIQRVIAIGAMLVREKRWHLATDLVLRRPSDPRFADRRPTYVTWIRHATTQVARAGGFTQEVDGKRSDVSLLWMVKTLVDQRDCLRQGLTPDDERVIDSICQFDLLAMLAALGAADRVPSSVYYPHFARFYESRSLPMLNLVVSDQDVRAAIFPNRSDQELADAIRWMDQSASQEGFTVGGWDGGFLGPTIGSFLDKHPPQGN